MNPEPSPSAPAAASTESITIERDDVRLAGTLSVPARDSGESVPLVILMHGFTGTQNDAVIRATAEALAVQGIASIRFDFDGNGASSGEHVDMTVYTEVADALAVFDYARALPYVSSIGLVGHSMGGVVAAMTAGELGDQAGALVLLAPATVLVSEARSGTFFGNRYDPADPPAYVTAFGFSIGREFLVTAQTLPLDATAAQFTGPVELIQGAADGIVPPATTEEFAAVFANSTFTLLDGQDHDFLRDPVTAGQTAAQFLTESLA